MAKMRPVTSREVARAASDLRLVLGQLVRGRRPAVHDEVVGRSDHRHAHVRADPHGNHILRNRFPQPHSSVKALSDDVHEAGFSAKFDMQIGIGCQ